MIDFVSVGKKITYNRKKMNITQDDLAEKLFVSRQLVSKWENGTGAPTIDCLLNLSKLFHISIEELLCLDDDIVLDEDNIFTGHERMYVIKSIINQKVKVDIPNVLYQMSPVERMMILKAFKEGKLVINLNELLPKLTPSEIHYIRKGEKQWY